MTSATEYIAKQQAGLLKKPGPTAPAYGPHRPLKDIKREIKSLRDEINRKEIAKNFYYGTPEYKADKLALQRLRSEFLDAGGNREC